MNYWPRIGVLILGLASALAPFPAFAKQKNDDRSPLNVDGPPAGKARYVWFKLFLDKTTAGKFDYKDRKGGGAYR